jgi:hypothetical protein
LENTLPKKIWFLWLQGMDNAPVEVKTCYQSWIEHNPGWEVIFLEEKDITTYITLPKWDVAKYVISEILRINLLAQYGGVWVDATCFCNKPLDEWLPAYMSADFFAFERPGPDRMLSSWFLASNKYSYITDTYKNKVNEYWNKYKGIRLIEGTRWEFLRKKMDKRDPQLWFNSIFTRVLKVHPYFWFHHTFENIYLKDANFKQLWDSVPKINALIPAKLFFAGLFNPISEELKRDIDEKVSPVYKLTWKYQTAQYQPGTVMYYLFHPDAASKHQHEKEH